MTSRARAPTRRVAAAHQADKEALHLQARSPWAGECRLRALRRMCSSDRRCASQTSNESHLAIHDGLSHPRRSGRGLELPSVAATFR